MQPGEFGTNTPPPGQPAQPAQPGQPAQPVYPPPVIPVQYQPQYPPPQYRVPYPGQYPPPQYPPQYGPPQYGPPLYPPGYRPPVKRRTGLRIALILTGLAVLVGLPGAAVATIAVRAAHTNPIVLPPMPTPTDATAVGENTRERATYVSRAMATVLAEQDKAMIARDEAAYVKVGASSAATSALRLRYRNLAAMKVAEYHVTASFPRADKVKGQWTTSLSIEFCFGVRGCDRDTVIEDSVWKDTTGGPVLMSLKASPTGDDWYQNTQPWELTPLSVLVGTKAVVAASPSLKGRLSTLLKETEKAIGSAEKYSVGETMDYYRVYLASPSDWRKWFGGQSSKWVAGFTIPTGPHHADVVLNNAEMPPSYLAQSLRHELTHAVSIYGKSYGRYWWLVEGYAANAEHGLTFSWAAATRSYVRGSWNKTLPASGPDESATDSSVGARYGVAFLAVHRLEMKYGRATLIKFFQQVIRHGSTLEMASPDILGASWATVEADCVRYIKSF